MKPSSETTLIERENNDNSYWLLPLSAIIGALVCAVFLTLLNEYLTLQVSVWEQGIGAGIFILFYVAPIHALFGAIYGVIIYKVLFLVKQGKINKASRLCIFAGMAIIIFYAVIYPLGWNPSGFDHISAVTNEHSTKAQTWAIIYLT